MFSKRACLFLTGVLLLASIGGGFAMNGGQLHMRAALHALETASMQMNKAGADKGGHQAKALSLIRQAITEVKAAMAE